MNLEQLRKQAKERTKERRAAGEAVKLADVQRELAREHGYRSWPALAAAVEANAEAFVLAATSGRRDRAERMLEERPEIERDPWARLVLGRGFDGDPNAPGGPRGWAPILYVCHSVFASAELARALLARGADPNATFTNEYGEMSALYGAAGVVHDPELTRVLLEAGANPNDGESVYHACETPDPACLRLLLEHGAVVAGTNALAHAVDWERREHLRLLLDHGADPNEGRILYWAVMRGRDAETLRTLVEHGTDLDPEALRAAFRRGRGDQVEALRALGISFEPTALDRAVAAIRAGERGVSLPEPLDADAEELLVETATGEAVDAVVDAIGASFTGRLGGGPPATLLHQAAWLGNTGTVRRLLARGADPSARATTAFATPLGWAVVGSAYAGWGERDHVGVAELLVAAGAELEERFLETAEGPLLAWLEERL